MTATIWFEADVQSLGYNLADPNSYPNGGPTTVSGVVHTHPEFVSATFYMHDVGVVVLDTPKVMDEYGVLPKSTSSIR